MIKAARVVIDGNKSYNNCEILLPSDNEGPNFFEDNQILIKDKHGSHITTNFVITYIQLKRRMSPTPDAIKAKRINISSDITFAPVWIIKDHRQHDIPDIFGYPFQFTFIDSNHVAYITNDVNMILIDL